MEEVEVPSCQNNEHSPIAKGKRTKRHRPLSPIAFTITSPTIGPDKSPARPNPNFSTALSEDSTTTEEEDTAKSLILLARGHYPPNPNGDHDFQFSKLDNRNKKRYTETAATTSKVSDGACMYACKTCNRAFASFQALGGHRASHTKPKNEKRMLIYDNEDFPSPSKKSRMSLPHDSLSLQLNNISTTTTTTSTVKPFPSPRMHECSYCGMEFTSGQALGGHMRRHRAGPNNPSPYPSAAYIVMGPDEPKKPVNGLSLDLNLPAPEDENKKIDLEKRQQQQQQNEAAKKCLALSTTPTLVDCPF